MGCVPACVSARSGIPQAGLAKLLRAGELSALWLRDERHEAMRDLLRALKGREEVTKEIVRTARELFKQGTSQTQFDLSTKGH